jgi:hypothetical protein
MKKLVVSLAVILCIVFVMHGYVVADNPIPKVGEVLPSIKLKMPEKAEYRNYLGLSGSGEFSIPDIKAQVVIIEIFSMY